MTVKHWNTGASAVRFREQAGKQKDNTKKKKITLDQKYKDWEKWLDKCPVDWTSSRHPTSFIETINFDFTEYESKE